MPSSRELAGFLEVSAELVAVRRLAAFLREACTAAGVDEAVACDCEAALVEAANNVVEHGYAGQAGGTMALEIRTNDNQVRMVLTDKGHPVPEGFFTRCGIVPLDSEEGRGCGIIRSCVDEIDYASLDGVNRLMLVKRL